MTLTPDQQATLDHIKSECRRAIELGEKATPLPWFTANARHLMGGPTNFEFAQFVKDDDCETEMRANRRLIVHSRTFSPLAAQALLKAFTALELIMENDSSDSEDARDDLVDIITNWKDTPQ